MTRESKGDGWSGTCEGESPQRALTQQERSQTASLHAPEGLGGHSLWPVSDRTGQDRTGIAAALPPWPTEKIPANAALPSFQTVSKTLPVFQFSLFNILP